MSPGERDELLCLRKLLEYALHRLDEVLVGASPKSDLATGKTPAAIVRALTSAGRPLKPADIREMLTSAGREVSSDAVYQACHRLAKARTIQKADVGRYAA